MSDIEKVKKLREATGAGFKDCNLAIKESGGDLDKAIEILRVKGISKASKKMSRDAKEGVVAVSGNENKISAIEVNCETDFVAKNEDFGKLADTIATIATNNLPENLDGLLSQSFDGNGLTINDKITEQTGVIGEKIEISGYELIKAPKVVAYNHPGNQIASIVGLTADSEEEGKQVAMQVAAMNPIALDKDSVPQEVVQKEIEVGKELAIQEGKPAEMAEKIAMGRLNKFFKETTLLNQAFIRDNKKTVQQFLKDSDPDLSVTDFKRISLSI